MKKVYSLFLASILTMSMFAVTKTVATVEKLWSRTVADIGTTLYDSRQGAGYNGTFYIANKSNHSLVAITETTKDTLISGETLLNGTAYALDDAGNFVMEGTFPNTPSHLVIRKADGSDVKDLAITGLARTDFINAVGDVFSAEGGYVFVYGNSATGLLVYKIVNGAIADTKTVAVAGVGGGNYVIDGNDTMQIVHHRTSEAGWVKIVNGEATTITGMEGFKNTTLGGDIITLKGKEFYIYPTGSVNYNSQFVVRNMTDGAFVVDKADATNTVFFANDATKNGGASFPANWLNASPIDENSAYIHLYNAADGIALFKLSVGASISLNFDESKGNVSTSNLYTSNKLIELSANPNYGYHFTQWTDGNKDNPRTILFTQDTTFSAEFAKNTYSLTVSNNTPDLGSVAGSANALYLDELTISAEPNYGYHFAQWSDGVTDNPRTIILERDTTIVAEFAKNYYAISKQCDNVQGAIIGVEQAEYLDTVILSADANYGYYFTQWADGVTDNPRSIIISRDTTIIAEFAKNTYSVTTTSANTDRGTTSGDGSALYLEQLTISATPNYGYHFAQWSDGVTDNPRTIILSRDTAFTAEFVKNSYTITKQCDNVQGAIIGVEQAEYLDTVILSADAKYGYHFTQWSDGITDNPRAIIISRDTTIIAEFAKNTYSLVVSNNTPDWGMTAGTTSALHLDELTISATPNYGYHFVRWSDGNTDNPRTIILSRDTTFTAEFAKNNYIITQQYDYVQGSISGLSQAEYMDTVRLSASANYGYHFTQWADGVTDNPRTIILASDTSFTAEFAKNAYTISITTNTAQWGMTKDTSVLYLDDVELHAVPNYGYHFDHWDDLASLPSNWVSASQARSIAASLGTNQITSTRYTVYGYIVGTYGNYDRSYYISDKRNGEGIFVIYYANQSASIGDYVAVNSYLTNWHSPYNNKTALETTGGGILQHLNTSDNPKTVTATESKSYKAVFAKNTYHITYDSEQTMGTVSGITQAEYLDEVVITANNKYGYHFVRWSNGCAENPYTFTLNQDTTLTAIFEKNLYSITKQSNEEQGVISGLSQAEYLDEVTLTAEAYYGYHFTQWTDGNTDNPRTITITRDTTITAVFAKNSYMISTTCNDEQGAISGLSQAEYMDEVVLTAEANYGYHFTHWTDGLTDNPRTIEVTRDTTLSAEFAVDKYGECGDNLQLEWKYDSDNKILTISGNGNLSTNKRYGVEAVYEMTDLIIEDGVGIIGDSAFANITTLETVSIGKDVRKIQDYAFGNCYSLTSIYNYRRTPATAFATTFEDVDKFACTLYVFAGSEDMFRSATGWRDFYSIQPIGAETTTTDVLTITPAENTADVVWPAVEDAATYELTIRDRSGNIICTLVFNSNGQLTSIAFSAPGRAQTAGQSAGFSFTVTGLDKGTGYDLTLTAKDNGGNTISSATQSFTTTGGVTTDFEDMDITAPVIRKQIINDMLYILLPDGRKYSATGVKVE